MYYTPKIEEFHPLFEFEEQYEGVWDYRQCWYNDYLCMFDLSESEWTERFRVKCLDEQDILSLGFTRYDTDYFTYYEKNRISLKERSNGIYFLENLDTDNFLFLGKIKNKSELKKILNQIEICIQ